MATENPSSRPGRARRAVTVLQTSLIQTILRQSWLFLGKQIWLWIGGGGAIVSGIITWFFSQGNKALHNGSIIGFLFCLLVVLLSITVHIIQERRARRPVSIPTASSDIPIKCIKHPPRHPPYIGYSIDERFQVPAQDVSDYLKTGAFVEINHDMAVNDLVSTIPETISVIQKFSETPPGHGSYYPHGDFERGRWGYRLEKLGEVANFAEKFDGKNADYKKLRGIIAALVEETRNNGRLDVYQKLSSELAQWLGKRLDLLNRSLRRR